jgi:hypothetical protein
MKILISENQLETLSEKISQEVDERSRSFAFTRKKRLFSKNELSYNPLRYRKYERDLDEMDVFKFSEKTSKKKSKIDTSKEYNYVVENFELMKKINEFSYYVDFFEDDDTQIAKVSVLDDVNKIKVADAEFQQLPNNSFLTMLPIVKNDYRRRGIAKEIYKLILTYGDLLSGRSQSKEATLLWKSLYREFPNNMVFIDQNKNEHEVELKDDVLVIKKTGEDVHSKNIGGQLKIYQIQ